MCGIAGFVGGFVPGLMCRMNAVQAHRGPDASGVFEDPEAQAALGHVRLAILDLSEQASQPMVSRDGRYVLVFNGEIYNYRELRAELRNGYPFQSTGDTEVLLRGLQRSGIRFLEKLNGMFALALWDRRQRELLLARDHLGIKPLYYAQPAVGQVLFSSELKAICAHPAVRREPDFIAIEQHLALLHPSENRTAIRGIRRLPPGAMLRWRAKDGRVEQRQFWKPDFQPQANWNRQDAAASLRQAIQQAVRRQTVSDVPVGSLLSGGIDSSLITAIAADISGNGLQCYSSTYPSTANRLDQAHADGPYARLVAHSLDLPLREIEITADLTQLWPSLLYHLDEPIADPAAINCYLLSQLARDNGTTVLLSGQGADELFGGYPRYAAMFACGWFEWMPLWIRQMLAQTAATLPGACRGPLGAQIRRFRRGLVELPKSPDERFLAYCASTPTEAIRRLWHDDLRQRLERTGPLYQCCQWMRDRRLDGIDRYLDRDLCIYLPNHNLLYTDRMSMAVGLEMRVPLLDLELVELALKMPAQWKASSKSLKAILRDAARGLVQDAVIDRPKAGFGAPYRGWLRHDLHEMWEDLTSAASVNRRGWFDRQALVRIRQSSQRGWQDLYMLQWAVLSLELWARQFLDANPAEQCGKRSLCPATATAVTAAGLYDR